MVNICKQVSECYTTGAFKILPSLNILLQKSMNDFFLGLELSGSQLRIACFKKIEGKKYKLTFLDKLVVDIKNAALPQLIREWLRKNWLIEGDVDAVLAIPESSIFLKEFELPKAEDKQITQMLRWELSKASPIPPDVAIYEWKRISEKDGLTRVLSLVVKSWEIEQIISLFEEAGIRIVAIEPSSLALTRVAKANFEKISLLLTVQEEESNLIILEKGTPVFSTSTSVLLEGMKRHKRRLKKEIVEDLAESTKKVISFWEAKGKGKIEQVVITGEVAYKYYGLAMAVNRFAHMPVFFAKNKKIADVLTSGISELILSRNLMAFGAGVRYFLKDDYREVNFLPQTKRSVLEKEKRQRQIINKSLLFGKINLVILITFFLLIGTLKIWDITLGKKISQTKLFVNNHPAQQIIPEINKTNQMLSNIITLVNEQRDTGERLRRISSLTPENVVFESLVFSLKENEEWKISGISNRKDILAFYEKLKMELGETRVEMPYSNLNKEADNKFEIIVVW